MKRYYSACILLLLLLCCSSVVKGQLPTKTQLIARDDKSERHDDSDYGTPTSHHESSKTLDDKKYNDSKDGREGPPAPPPPLVKVTTEINVVYTTIIYTSSSPVPTVFNVSNAGYGHQKEEPSSTASAGVSDPNNSNSLQKKYQDDQLALKRMIMILSLVGGLGAIAVVATVIIFTKMRAKNRKLKEADEEGNEGSTVELGADMDQHMTDSDGASNNNNGSGSSPAESVSNVSSSAPTSSPASISDGRALIEPSAPPALMMVDGLESFRRNRRNIISMISQTTAPSPSAPTAKELDGMGYEEGATTSTSFSQHLPHHQLNSHNCSQCAPLIMMTPELPPPAYTPSAPPHYALPIEVATTETSPSSSLPSRRHSLGD